MKTSYNLISVETICLLFFLSLFGVQKAQSQEQLTNLPTFYITTNDGTQVSDKTTWKDGRVVVKSTLPSEEIDMQMQIRGRGNSTMSMPKKPYRIKFLKGNKINLLGLPAKERNWVLLANYADKTLMRNALAFEIGHFLEMEYTPPVRFVDVVYNGSFQGNYMLTDQLEVAKYRVPVEEQDVMASTEPDITGGYLLEIDGFADSYPPEPEFFYSKKDSRVKFVIKYPKDDEINAAQRTYIRNYIADFEESLYGNNFTDPVLGYRAKVDTVSLVNWYIACELTGNSDSFWQVYLYKKRNNDKLYFGPLWDYDIAFNNDLRLADKDGGGNYIAESAVNKLMRTHAHEPRSWIIRFWQDFWFQEAVERRWKEIMEKGIREHLLDYIDDTAALLAQSQEQNFNKWNILNRRVYQEVLLFNTYDKGVNYLKDYVDSRVDFLQTNFIISDDQRPSVPFVAENRLYKIANVKTHNVFSIEQNVAQEGATIVAWENQENDDRQLWRIVESDDGYFRIIDKESRWAIAGDGLGSKLKLAAINEGDATQKWEVIPVGLGNKYGFVNKYSKYSINNSGGGLDNGNPIIEYTSKVHQGGSDNQNWYFHKLPLEGGTTQNGIYAAIDNIQIYPNPVFSYAYVDFSCGSGVDVRISLYNLAGGVLYDSGYNYMQGEASVNLPVSGLAPGVYLLELKTASGQFYTSKLIKY